MGVIEASGFAQKGVQMTEKKQGAAEWLRGIIDEYRANGAQSCSAMARMLGINCEDETCRGCMTRMMTAIADRIDAERALPEGIEWPRFEDGELVKIGDEVEYGGKALEVDAICFDREESSMALRRNLDISRMSGSYGDRVKRPTPKVLDADGVPIEVGDTVYFALGKGRAYTVERTDANGGDPSVDIVEAKDGCPMYSVNPEILTHERPDSWERIEEDAKLAPRAYLEARGMNPEKTERVASMMADLVRRAKALAKAGEQG